MANSVIIPHIVGTVALLMMFFSVGTFYQDYYTNLHEKAYEAQLNQVANYVASNLVDLVSLNQMISGDKCLVKTIEIPYSIGENLYNVSLIPMISSGGDINVIRVIAFIEKMNLYAMVDLPWSVDSSIMVYTNQTLPRSDIFPLNNIVSNKASADSRRTGKPVSMVVWSLKEGDRIVIGLGTLDKS
ncbi:hypothetical protein KEJ47_07435 [Candidatus Bathyarchaeota archaeon]|nr:hypothetical protein [Candidatus Bathyarchaeota archaeon]